MEHYGGGNWTTFINLANFSHEFNLIEQNTKAVENTAGLACGLKSRVRALIDPNSRLPTTIQCNLPTQPPCCPYSVGLTARVYLQIQGGLSDQLPVFFKKNR